MFDNRTTVSLETALSLLTIFFVKKNRARKGDTRPIMTESIGVLDQLIVPNFEVDQDEVSVFDVNVGSIYVPESLPEDIYKLSGMLSCFFLTTEHKAIEILVQTPFHKIPKASQCKQKEQSDILMKFGLDYQETCAKSPAHALSLIPYREPIIEHIVNDDKLPEEVMLRRSCNALNAVIVLLSDCDALPIQTLMPKKITCGYPYIIYQSEDGFHTTRKKNFPKNFCDCGKDRPKIECCKNLRCKCIKAKLKCTERCQCHHCHNMGDKTAVLLVKKKTQTCRCGRGEKRLNSGESCVGARCCCYKNEWSCDDLPKCMCRNCYNPLGERIVDIEKDNSRKDLPKHHGKLRVLGSDDNCYLQEGIEKKDSKWTDEETVALFIIRKYFEKQDEVQKVYNYVRHFMSALNLREKTPPQICAKIVNIKKYMCMYHTECQHVSAKNKA